jgi:DNA helicase-2/ATP-dependent DNA helicase PcrA
VRLETNYRSTPHILSAASGLIANNRGRLGKTLRPCKALSHDRAIRVKLYAVQNGLDEAQTVVSHIQNERSKGTSYEDMAILVRSGWQTRLFEDRLMHRGIPYRIVGGMKFYERQEIRDIIAYLRLIVYPHDDLSFERALSVPKRGLGDKVIELIRDISKAKHIPMSEAALLAAKKLKGKQAAALETFSNQFARWRALNNGQINNYEFVRVVLSESGYVEMWKNSKKEEGETRLKNIQEFCGMLRNDYRSIAEFLEYLTLFASAHEDVSDTDCVSIMTMHAAKGLEFDIVFLPSWEMGVFPNEKSVRDTVGGGLEEERRLAYVSITRAKKRCEIYFATSRQMLGNWQRNLPSIFIGEIPRECIDIGEF